MTTEKICAAESNDADLVAESLAGSREAFRHIVERHQTLVCSLACCANAITAMGLYVVLFLGSLKGAFFGLVSGVGILYLRSRRTVSKTGVRF